MSYSYSGGTTTPGYGGLVEFPTTLRINDGTHRPISVPPFVQTAPLDLPVSDLPIDSGFASTSRVKPWAFDIGAFFKVASPDDVQAAIDDLRAKVNAYQGAMVVKFKAKGWADYQTMTLWLAGQVNVEDPDPVRKKVPQRTYTIPVLAPDPRRYALTPVTTTVTAATALVNNGTTPTPIDVKFNGPRNVPVLDGPGSGNTIQVNINIASGHWVRVRTVDPSTGLVSAVDDTGADVRASVDVDRCRYINPGSSNWTVTSSSGSGNADVTHADAYA